MCLARKIGDRRGGKVADIAGQMLINRQRREPQTELVVNSLDGFLLLLLCKQWGGHGSHHPACLFFFFFLFCCKIAFLYVHPCFVHAAPEGLLLKEMTSSSVYKRQSSQRSYGTGCMLADTTIQYTTQVAAANQLTIELPPNNWYPVQSVGRSVCLFCQTALLSFFRSFLSDIF